MKNIKNDISRSPITVNIGDLNLNVFRVGASPLLNASDGTVSGYHIKATHTHFTYEIFFITSGVLKLVTDRGTKEYENSVIIVPPKTRHVSVPMGGESYCLLFSFNGNSGIEEQLNQGVCELPINEEIIFYIKRFTEKSFENSPSAKIDENYLAGLLFNNIFSNIKDNNLKIHNAKKHTSRHINTIETYINNRLTASSSKLTLTEVSKNVYLSPKQISRIIEKEYGCTFSNLITEKRLAVAAAMLKNTDIKISEIANQTFFGSEKYFYRVFKSKYGISPLKYRKEIRISEKQ